MPLIPNKDIAYKVDGTDLETLRARVAEGIADADAGRLSEAEEVYARLRAHIEAIATSTTR
jgi:predicted transcriptional regulator